MLNVLIVEGGRQKEKILFALLEILSSRSLFKQMNVETVENIGGLKNKLQLSAAPDIVILLADLVPTTAEKLAAVYLETKFLIFASHIPKGKVIWIEREWINPEFLKTIINHIEY